MVWREVKNIAAKEYFSVLISSKDCFFIKEKNLTDLKV